MKKTVKENEKYDYERVIADARADILRALLPEVVFDGWSEGAFKAAIAASHLDASRAHLAFPRGVIDAAIEFHRQADREMAEALAERASLAPRFRDKIAAAVILRLEIAARHKEEVRRAASLMALPQNMATGTALIWETVDHIWRGLGDDAQGFSYYSKRASLATVYSSTLLYWLQDDDLDMKATKEFLDRRIDNVMQFGKVSSALKKPFERQR